MSMKCIVWFFVVFLITPMDVVAQKLVRGRVLDAATGETLPAANIQIDGTYQGTISNAEGVYELRLRTLPATLVVRYIGYETTRLTVTAASDERQDLQLKPVTYKMDEVVVSGEDPAIQIMREVIERKKVWRAALETYETEAYNRFTLANDTGIVSIIETFTDTFWDHEQGMKETLKARRETANLDIEEALPAAFFVTNLYDDDIEVGGYALIGVTHPDALRHYRFSIEGTRYLDDQLVYDIAVRPRNKLKSAFEGRVSVLDDVYALIDVELQPGEAFLFPPPIDRYEVTYRQQYSNFGGAFWLPVDFRSEMVLNVGFSGLLTFPTIHIDQVSRFTDYQVNVPLPDSLYAEDDYLVVDSVAVTRDTLLTSQDGVVPLSAREEVAYASIDSTMGLEKAFMPTGLLARFVDMDADSDNDGSSASAGMGGGNDFLAGVDFSPELWYNRVDGAHGGLEASIDLTEALTLSAGGGYNSGLSDAEQWSYQGGVRIETGDATEYFAEVAYEAGTGLQYDSPLYNRFLNGVAVLLGGEDYYDYYRKEGFRVQAGIAFDRPQVSIQAEFRSEDHASLPQTTNYDLLGTSPLRENPSVFEGDLRSLSATLAMGDSFNPLGLFGQNRMALSIEHSDPDLLGGDMAFTRYDVAVDGRLPTFFSRRLLSNTLDVRLVAGTSVGDLPPQRRGSVDGSLGIYSPFGGLRTREGTPYTGDQYAAFFWEHNFRTVPFEILGLRRLAQDGYNLIVFGGHGRTWIDENTASPLGSVPRVPDGFHHELGVSLSGIFRILRLDLATRLDEPGFAVGVSAARIF